MRIKKIYIKNFKSFRKLELDLNFGVNILVGNNEAGKSTILEAIHLALTGLLNGKYLKNDLTEYLFNIESIKEYLENPESLPFILIEIFFEDGKYPLFEGTLNYEKKIKKAEFLLKLLLMKNTNLNMMNLEKKEI